MKKRIFATLLSAVLLVSLCSCGDKKEKTETPDVKEPVKYEDVTSEKNNDKFVYADEDKFDGDFIVAFVDEYFGAKKVDSDETLTTAVKGAKFKNAVIGNAKNIKPEVARAVVEDTVNAVLKENPVTYNVNIVEGETSVTVKIIYTVA